MDDGELCIGVVVPVTGRLARLGDPLTFAAERLATRLPPVVAGGRRRPVRIACRDSRSDPVTARRAVRELARDERVHVVVTMAGTKVLPAVADTCERLRVPCVSTTFPWQAYVFGRDRERTRPFGWTFHFAWGLDDIATVFAEMWERLGAARTVGCLWNGDLQGRMLRDPDHGFVAAAAARGHTMVDAGGYDEPATGFDRHLDLFLDRDAGIVTSAASVADLDLFRRQARRRGLSPRLITCSRWLAYPRGDALRQLDGGGIATIVYWSPHHPYRSSLDGTTPAELVAAYERHTGNQWLQPLGLAHALLEVAYHALSDAADPADHGSIAEAVARTRLETIAGPLDWTRGPTPNVALLPLVGGQWQPGRRHPYELAVVTNSALPEVPVTADLVTAR